MWRVQSAIVRRATKTASALAGGQVVNVLSQVLLPPAYIAFYGIGVYGEWLTLSAAAAWLLTLDFGLQSFITNALCIEYNRGNLERFRQMQSVALRICLGIVTAGLLAGCQRGFSPDTAYANPVEPMIGRSAHYRTLTVMTCWPETT